MNNALPGIIEDIIRTYLSKNKLGRDDLSDLELFHPMAEAKFISMLCVLYDQKLISDSYFIEQLENSCDVLSEHNLSGSEKRNLYGPGFEWLDCPHDEPYLITSSLCTTALIDAAIRYPNPRVQDALNKSLQGLLHWFATDLVRIGNQSIASYSPHVRVPIFNPSAHASATLIKAARLGFLSFDSLPDLITKTYHIIEQYRVDGVGWSYSIKRPVSDLTHISYIGQLYIEKLKPNAAEIIFLPIAGQYFLNGVLYERVRILKDYASSQFGRGSLTNAVVRKSGNTWFTVDLEHARLWGVSEMLVTAAYFAANGSHKQYWKRMISQILCSFDRYASPNIFQEIRYPRHYLHFAHGLACCLPFLPKDFSFVPLIRKFS